MKILVNKCFGGFAVSDAFLKCWREMHPESKAFRYSFGEQRTNPEVIALVERLGEAANGPCSRLMVVEIPSEATDWMVDEYDGIERIICVVDGKLTVV